MINSKSIGLLITLSLLSFFIYNAHNFWFKWEFEPNFCDMTHMFPNYLKLKDFTSSSKYELYLYREAGVQQVDTSLSTLKGIPILFIPGNSGSYKQVRSIASESARFFNKPAFFYDFEDNEFPERRKMHTTDTPTEKFANEYDFYTIHFQEEFSALSGDLLHRQTMYVNDCIKYILSLYKEKKPTRVMLLGHSMGGVVARTVFQVENYVPGTVNTIITLNSPQHDAALFIHPSIGHFYERTNQFWRENLKKNFSYLSDVAIVSIAGGIRDTLVRSDLAYLDDIVPPYHGFSVMTTSIPNNWISVDHQCIMWCNQIVKAVCYALYDMIDPATGQATLPLERRVKAFEKNLKSKLVGYFGFESRKDIQKSKCTFEYKGDVEDKLNLVDIKKGKYLMKVESGKDFFAIANLPKGNYSVYAKNRVSQEYFNITSNVVSLPKYIPQGPHSILYLSSLVLSDFDTIAVEFSKNFPQRSFTAQLYSSDASSQSLQINPFITGSTTLQIPEAHPLLLNLTLQSHSKLFPFRVSIKSNNKNAHFSPITYQYSSSMKEEVWKYSSNYIVRVHSKEVDMYNDVSLLIMAPPGSLEITFEYEMIGFFVELVRVYGSLLFALVFSLLFFVFAIQFKEFRDSGVFPPLLGTLLNTVAIYGPIVIAAVSMPFLSRIIGVTVLPKEWLFYWTLLVVLLAAITVLTLLTFTCKLLFIILSTISTRISPFIRLPKIAILATALFLCLFVEPALVLAIAVLFFAPTKNEDKNLKEMHFSLFVVYVLSTALLAASILLWIRNLPWLHLLSPSLPWDATTGFVLIALCHITFARDHIPKPSLLVSVLLCGSGLLCGVYCLEHFYRVNQVVAVILAYFVLSSVMFPATKRKMKFI